MKVAITGTREVAPFHVLRVCATLDDLLAGRLTGDVAPLSLIIGDANGVDAVAREWARQRDVPHEVYLADWITIGAAAGPARNRRMLICGEPDLLIAFPGGKGTANMVAAATKLGVRVLRVEWR